MEPRSGPWAVCDAAWGVRDSGLLLPQDSDWPTEAACLLGKPITHSLPPTQASLLPSGSQAQALPHPGQTGASANATQVPHP